MQLAATHRNVIAQLLDDGPLGRKLDVIFFGLGRLLLQRSVQLERIFQLLDDGPDVGVFAVVGRRRLHVHPAGTGHGQIVLQLLDDGPFGAKLAIVVTIATDGVHLTRLRVQVVDQLIDFGPLGRELFVGLLGQRFVLFHGTGGDFQRTLQAFNGGPFDGELAEILVADGRSLQLTFGAQVIGNAVNRRTSGLVTLVVAAMRRHHVHVATDLERGAEPVADGSLHRELAILVLTERRGGDGSFGRLQLVHQPVDGRSGGAEFRIIVAHAGRGFEMGFGRLQRVHQFLDDRPLHLHGRKVAPGVTGAVHVTGSGFERRVDAVDGRTAVLVLLEVVAHRRRSVELAARLQVVLILFDDGTSRVQILVHLA